MHNFGNVWVLWIWKPLYILLCSDKFCHCILAKFLHLLHTSLLSRYKRSDKIEKISHLTPQPGHVGFCHFQRCLEEFLCSEDFANRDKSHHGLLVKLDQQLPLGLVLQLLEIIHLTQLQEWRSMFLEQVLIEFPCVDEPNESLPHLLRELNVCLALNRGAKCKLLHSAKIFH